VGAVVGVLVGREVEVGGTAVGVAAAGGGVFVGGTGVGGSGVGVLVGGRGVGGAAWAVNVAWTACAKFAAISGGTACRQPPRASAATSNVTQQTTSRRMVKVLLYPCLYG
jgi:hypothetical protein